jgi:hypothetical protein
MEPSVPKAAVKKRPTEAMTKELKDRADRLRLIAQRAKRSRHK